MYYKVTNGAIEMNSKSILEEVNLEIKDKDRIAIIGRNGAGKTTLLKAIIDQELFSEGVGSEKFHIMKSGNYQIGYLNQNNAIHDDFTLLEEILENYRSILKIEEEMKLLEEKLEKGATTDEILKYQLLQEQYALYGGYEYKKEYMTAILKFGFTGRENERIKNFSGGEKTKIAFLKLLLSKPDLLLLDEPTNHLDMDAIIWLEDYLKKYPSTFIIVSHDRMFINQTTNKIIEIEYGKTEEYIGNYENYESEKKKRLERAIKDYDYQQKEIKRLQGIADRFRYKPSKASMAMAKLKQIERMEKLSLPEKENLRVFHMKFDDFVPSHREVLKIDHLKIGYNSVLNTCSFSLFKSERLGIIGENGVGKSTLLKTIIGSVPSLGGEISIGRNVTIGYFDQELHNLNDNLTIYEEYQSKFPTLNDFQIRKNLASFLFLKEDITKKINVLSGGEKVRLQLCEVITKKPNFLILDEPTNHLDILSKERLEEILKDYPGTILFVSHDRYFVNKLATSLFVFYKEETKYYPFTYKEYMEHKNEPKNSLIENKKIGEKSPKKENISSKKEKEKRLKKLEKEIGLYEKEIKILKEELFQPDIYSNYIKCQEKNEKIVELEKKLDQLLLEWENEL